MPDEIVNLAFFPDNETSPSASRSSSPTASNPPKSVSKPVQPPARGKKPSGRVSAVPKDKPAAEGEEPEGKRSASWVTDVIAGVSLERQLVDWMVADELIKKYKQACGFHDHTGQGVKSNQGQKEFDRQLHKIYKYYELFDECLGERSGFRSKTPFGNLGELEQAWEECLGLKSVKAKRKKAEDGARDGQEDEDEVTGDAAKARKRQRLRANTKNTSAGPIHLKDTTKSHKTDDSEEDEDEIDEDEGEEHKTADKNKGRGKGKPNAIMDHLQNFLTEASKDRKAQMNLAKQMQSKREKRKDDKDHLKKTKEFRALAVVIGKELAWQQIFDEPFPTVQTQADIAPPASDPILNALDVDSVTEQYGFPLDPSLQPDAPSSIPNADAGKEQLAIDEAVENSEYGVRDLGLLFDKPA
ncbi:hypothetical protein QFC22_006473 [Naganishia vaughanmartiniae]|uniref:Uncharacterized protein n=1 Tax=Naganishia vaughanmartiniae TaxID=1424756 RepID=A0ACC2WM23_9TREE|nr:hypothetical protein QFC22_006473 [Naganishia vaughanmartiniae]